MQTDQDIGSSGPVLVKGHYVITGGKQGPIYLADINNLGGYDPNSNNSNVWQVC